MQGPVGNAGCIMHEAHSDTRLSASLATFNCALRFVRASEGITPSKKSAGETCLNTPSWADLVSSHTVYPYYEMSARLTDVRNWFAMHPSALNGKGNSKDSGEKGGPLNQNLDKSDDRWMGRSREHSKIQCAASCARTCCI